ncbi:MAG: N-acetyltransferase [Clostridium sp.]
MDIIIRQEEEKDYKDVESLIEEAFRNEEYSDHREHLLVNRLRKGDAFIKELSLVAECEGVILGHIMLTKINIKGESGSVEALALAPVSVIPSHQRKGIGSRLIKESIRIAKNLNYDSIILLGHPEYYPRFGFNKASDYEIYPPFEVPDECFMALELNENSLDRVNGTVVYSKEFME